ncbi:hypothetical protein BGW38_007533 [Lunasporangiospora selenospora]|uniref:EamA domain-containing protein n=1 Tax=Lunasporangiospora selenospora TaxID=979761 RepID=A0A9P6FYU5_9FUNG|nr:hypothetical protein BGW38_007533 [Lunasporangiospora selenospora]
MGYHKPYFILYIAHSFWAILLPLQFIFSSYISKDARQSLSTFRERAEYFADLVRQSTRELFNKKADYTLVCGTGQNHAIPANLSASTLANTTAASKYSSSFTSREKKVLARHLFWVTLTMTILFMVPSYLWYTGVALTSMANLTAIYNTACFFAYLFSVLLLREKIVLNKVIAVFLSLLGVGIIFLASRLHSNPPDDDNKAQVVGKSSIVGDTVALVCAALYGFEEVMYKKYASVKIHSVTFANTMTGLMGVLTLVFLWVPIPILHWAGYEIFELPKVNEFLSILMIAVLGLVYNGCFMIVVSMTNPVFAAVGVMATIPIVALTDWLLFKEPIGWGNIAGGLCILIGFAILTRENHKSLKNM